MKRRDFLSMMIGAAGAPLVPWRGLIQPLIVLPARKTVHICDGSAVWCHHPSHFKAPTMAEIQADIERTLHRLIYTPTHVSIGPGGLSLGGYYGPLIQTPCSPEFLPQGFAS